MEGPETLAVYRAGTCVVTAEFQVVEVDGETYVTPAVARQWEAMHTLARYTILDSSALSRRKRKWFKQGKSDTPVSANATSAGHEVEPRTGIGTAIFA